MSAIECKADTKLLPVLAAAFPADFEEIPCSAG
jgi:hypothetical protein